MALDITAQDLVVDETSGLQDDDVNALIAPYNANTTVQYLLSLDAAGGLSSPQVAYQSNFVIASASAGETINAIALAQNATGTPFSTTVGVNSGLRTVDGNYIWLFQDATHANVVIGVIGTSNIAAGPAETGPLAFSFALVGTDATHADLYTVEYVPLLHPDTTNADDRIDLADAVFASVSGSTTVSFTGQNAAPGINEFYLINSPSDATKQILVTGFLGAANATPNVSTQGFGVNNQSINPTERLQVDFVTGGTLSGGSASQIQYGSHIETITRAGFTINQVTPSNPNLRVDITISAFNVQGNEQGLSFFDGSPTNNVPITSIRLTGQSGLANPITADGTYDVAGSVDIVVSGMGTNAVTIRGLDNVTVVDVTTSSAMDRLTVTGVDSNEGLDITEFHFSSQTPNAHNEEVGSFINFDDDGPSVSITSPTVVGTAAVVEASGAGGQAQATITPPSYTAGGADGTSTAVTYALALSGATATGLVTTVGNKAISLVVGSDSLISGKYDSDNNGSLDATAFTVALSGTTVTLTSSVALEHSNAPQGVGEDNSLDLDGLINVVATVTVTDGDNDVVSTQSASSALSLTINDTDPSVSITSPTVVAAAAVVEASGAGGQAQATITPPSYTPSAVDGQSTGVTYALALAGATATGLVTTVGNKAISLVVGSGSLISGKYDSDGNGSLDATAFTVALSGTTVTLTSLVALEHSNAPQGVGEDNTLDLDGLINVVATVTVTDGDADVVSSQSTSAALSLTFNDTDPSVSITSPTVVAAAAVVEASGAGGQAQATITPPSYTPSAVDGQSNGVTYALALAGATATGLVTTVGNKAISLVVGSGSLISGKYDSDGNGSLDATAFTVALSGTTVTLTSLVALEHSNAPQGVGEDNTLDLDGLINVVATVTVTDGDADVVSSQSTSAALSLTFNDTDPSVSITSPTVVSAAAVVEASGAGGQAQATVTAPGYTPSAVDGQTTGVTYALALAGSGATGLVTTAGGFAISLVFGSDSLISGKYDSDNNGSLDATAFTVALSGTTVTLTSSVALEHANAPQGAGEDNTLDLDGLINLVATVTVTDGDADVVSAQSTASGLSLTFNDTDPTLSAPFDADPGTPGAQSPEVLGNAVGETASGAFGYAMTDLRAAAEYLAGGSDFVDANGALAGVQISLTGTVDNAQNPGITNAVATLSSESLSSATFNFSFHYDKDPLTLGVQDSTAGGTLVFDKVADTYTFTLTDVIDGFSFSVLHTNELVAKQPTGNTGHPLIVAEQLTANGDPDPFYVQFTANTVTNQIGFGFNATGDGAVVAGDTTFTGSAHDMVSNLHEDWVSATQATNGVAGDTIQKGELLTMRFFGENILGDVNPGAAGGGTERLPPTATSSGVVIKFDGVGNSEDLVVILDLIDANGNEITRAINVQNIDLIKGNANVPSPYSAEFTLDNNDALLIIEQNDYNDGTETYQIQGVQIMQSSNGLSGMGIDLKGGVGAAGDSSTTVGLSAWDPTDTDVLKIVDIGFVQQSSGTIDADLVFGFNIADGDGDFLGNQQINLHIGDVPAPLAPLTSLYDSAPLALSGAPQVHVDYFM